VPESPWILDSERNRGIVDGLRALGIVLVVAFHGAFVFAKVLPRPQFDAFVATMPAALNIVWQALGSEVVFFTSGFLLSYLLLREQGRYGSIDARTFWLRRGTRIVPLFVLALAIFMIGRTLHWDRLATNLLFCARISGFFELTPRGGKNYIPVGWSLEVMVHAYLLLPFLARLVVRTRWPLTVALLIAGLSVVPRYLALAAEPAAYSIPAYEIVEAGEIPQVHRDLYYLTWFRLTPFLLGLAAAVALTRHRACLERWHASPWRANASLALGLGLVAASGFLPLQDRHSFVYALFEPRAWLWFWSCQRAVLIVGLAIVTIALLTAPRGAPALLGRLLAWRGFGPISHGIYSIYLFHFAALIPAALLMFAPAVVEGIAVSPSLDRGVLLENISASIGSASAWQYLLMVLAAVWLSVRLAGFLTRRLETPAQQWLRRRIPRPERPLLPEVAAAEGAARNRLDGSGRSGAHPAR
jgi:peptidoglycan/LPS O-acetylase OafA/YrhL